MKRPVLTALIALFVVILGLLVAGMATSGQTRIVKKATLSASPERVWPFFADLRGWPNWYRAKDGTRMTYSVLTRGSASGLNAIRHAEESEGFWWQETVTDFDLNRRLELTGFNTPGHKNWRQEITLMAVGPEQTEVTWTLEYEVTGPITKLINKQRGEKRFAAYMETGLQNIAPLIPSAEEWGPPSLSTAKDHMEPMHVIGEEGKTAN